MQVFRKFLTSEIGATSVEWVILTAAIVAVTGAVSAVVLRGSETATISIEEDIVLASTLSQPTAAPQSNLEYKTIEVSFELMPNVAMVAPQPSVEACLNPTTLYSFETGLPFQKCLLPSTVLTATENTLPSPERAPLFTVAQNCTAPAYMYDLETQVSQDCQPVAKFQIPRPSFDPYASQHVNVASFTGPTQCASPSYHYFDFMDAPLEVCLTTMEIMPPVRPEYVTPMAIARLAAHPETPDICADGSCQYVRADEPTPPRFAAAPSFFAPEACTAPPCRYERDVPVQSLHQNFVTAPVFLAPEPCGNPPCLYSRLSGSPQPPSLPSYGAPEADPLTPLRRPLH